MADTVTATGVALTRAMTDAVPIIASAVARARAPRQVPIGRLHSAGAATAVRPSTVQVSATWTTLAWWAVRYADRNVM